MKTSIYIVLILSTTHLAIRGCGDDREPLLLVTLLRVLADFRTESLHADRATMGIKSRRQTECCLMILDHRHAVIRRGLPRPEDQGPINDMGPLPPLLRQGSHRLSERGCRSQYPPLGRQVLGLLLPLGDGEAMDMGELQERGLGVKGIITLLR